MVGKRQVLSELELAKELAGEQCAKGEILVSTLFCFTFRCEDQAKIKATELERRVLTKAECVEWRDEWDYEPRCGTSEKTFQ